MLTGDVAIQISVPRKTKQPSVERDRPEPHVGEPGAEACKEERDREEDDAEDVVRPTLDVAPHLRGGDLGRGVSRLASAAAASLYCGIANGVSGASGFTSGRVSSQAWTAGRNSLRKRLK